MSVKHAVLYIYKKACLYVNSQKRKHEGTKKVLEQDLYAMVCLLPYHSDREIGLGWVHGTSSLLNR